ncbi:MAG: hypothetical protein M3336_08565, partial [Chloroflexota bacterium]|nr:hypothetical protein [Chloroflexota bacterium]
FVARRENGAYEGDIGHYVYWTRLVTLGGIEAAYSGHWPETYAVYPPVTLYGYQVAGSLYRLLQDPDFNLQRAQRSVWLLEAIKLVALAWHLLTTAAIYLLVRQRDGRRAAALTSAAYVANPAAIFDVAHWGQPDGAHSLFSVLAVGWLGLGHVAAGWAAMSLAALSKPQAWVLLPLLAIASVRQGGMVALARGLLLGALAGAAVVLPFFTSGRASSLLTLPGTIGSVMPVVSANAHNLWWLVSAAQGIDPVFTSDWLPAIGPLSYRAAAALLVSAQLAFTYWLLWTGRVGLAEAAAMGVLGWFVFTTQAHENHLFFVLPLLALAVPRRRSLLPVLVALSLTVLANMALHDLLFLEMVGRNPSERLVERLRVLNAAANVVCLLGWSLARISSHHHELDSSRGGSWQEPRSDPARRAELQHAP